MVADARYGFADGSTILTSTLAPYGFPDAALTKRTAASRFSVPQQTLAPD